MEKQLEPMKAKLKTDRSSTEKYDEKVDEWKVSGPIQFQFQKMSGMLTADLQWLQCTCHGMASLVSQNKVEEAEKKKRQSQEQLDGITQQLSELQSTCSELKAKVQQQNAMLKSSEVSVGMKAVNLIKFHEVLRNTLILIIVLFNYYFFLHQRDSKVSCE